MRWLRWDKVLNRYESTRKSAVTGEYIDLWNHFYRTIKEQVFSKERVDLLTESDSYETDSDYFDNSGLDDLTDWR